MSSRRVDGRVSIVVLNWNSGELGERATASALAQEWPDTEVIVVDNASRDDSLERILAAHGDVTVVRNSENVGFGGGMNAGFAVATGAYFLPLNCDAELDPDYVATTIGALEEGSRRAAVGGRVESPRVGPTGPMRITPVMRTVPGPVDIAGRCDKLNGACPLFRTAALDDVIGLGLGHGPYDDRYFVYGEDVDLARTLTALGWELHYEPAARALHVRSFGSSPRLADRRGRLRTSTLHNRHRNIVRHAPAPWVAFSAFAIIQDVGFVLLRLLRRDRAVVPDMLRAWRGMVGTFPDDLRRRRRLRGVTP
jgi:GT2 family glycosyltransferase